MQCKAYRVNKTGLRYYTILYQNIFSKAQQPPGGHGLLIIEASRSHSDTPHSVGLLWTSAQTEAETSTWQDTALSRDKSLWPAVFEPAVPASERP